jgi:hypothetical protein
VKSRDLPCFSLNSKGKANTSVLVCTFRGTSDASTTQTDFDLTWFYCFGMQFVSTATTPKISADPGVHMAQVIDPQVGRILDRSCQDCHSSHTTWPWYSHVAPVSWIVAKHVSEGREMLNFSAWADKPHSADERMVICDAVSDHRMPLPSYTLIHRNAKLSKRDVKLICDWAAAGGGTHGNPRSGRGDRTIRPGE